MDDALSIPKHSLHSDALPAVGGDPETPAEAEAGDSDSGEEDTPDWTRFAPPPAPSGPSSASGAAGRKQFHVIPQRGEKEFEPSRAGAGETALQAYALQRARAAMLRALRPERGSSSKGITWGVWQPREGTVRVPHPRGQAFTTMGHFLPSSPHGGGGGGGAANASSAGRREARTDPRAVGTERERERQLLLLPEEALYLIERGSMFCTHELADPPPSARDPHTLASEQEEEEEEEARWDESAPPAVVPMSVQQAFGALLGRSGLTLERYQVYAHLRRLGYTVTRACAPEGPLFPRAPARPAPSASLPQRLWSSVRRWAARLRPPGARRDWWAPLRPGWAGRRWTAQRLFAALRLVPSGHALPLHSASPATTPEAGAGATAADTSPYEVFYHVWRPSTPWKKTAVPPPDFHLIVLNANTTRVPTLAELARVFSQLPVQPPPAPRKRPNAPPPAPAPAPPPTILTRLRRLLGLAPAPTAGMQQTAHRTPPFVALKAGRKTVVLAVVDGGSVSLVRFSQGVFEDWPMV
ncbi:hypothetical protein CALCODRAFT_487817 [Calocera cornea HHB12733]|uniref:tRNA-splicing endonuclease subunit Sen54 N-terminal domain-containing protein n=1 Tax=Calocera cornea HHB12733 TaxID=1353952 RepID=A0A165CX53_9BASI|nr:hypothetical protein CALCODRAFT_487817 [Calocera cornea HHB12733]